MIGELILPDLLIEHIGTDQKDFTVKASRAQPVKSSLGLIIFGFTWLAFTSIFVVAFLGPIFAGKEVHFTANDVPTVAGPGNLKPIILPAIFIGVFVLIGILVLGFGLYSMFKQGGYFVGTPLRLIHFRNGVIRSIDWEQFSGDIEMKGRPQKGDLTLGMRTGRMVSRKNGPDRYVPDVLYISGIDEVGKIERICRQRIKENDPTPTNAV